MSTTYRYQPVEITQIRLLRITRDGDDLLFTLIPTDIDAAPKYTTVSYTWGSSERTKKLYTSETRTMLPITASAYEVLDNICDDHPLVWLDMICINQDDIAERNHQVTLMGLIYRKSSHTVAYLGTANSDTEILNQRYLWRHSSSALWIQPLLAMWDLQDIDNEVSLRWVSQLLLQQLARPIIAVYPSPWPSDWKKSCTNLQYERPYFFRKWIIQEIIRSPTVTFQAGSHKMDLVDIAARSYGAGASVFDMKQDFPGSHARASAIKADQYYLRPLQSKHPQLYIRSADAMQHDYSEERWSSSTAFRFLAMLVDSQEFKCTDLRDKLFAILPLLSDKIPPEVMPDYASSVRDVYIRLSRYLLCNGAAEALALTKYGHNESLPSWCVDWSQQYALQSERFADGNLALLMRGKMLHTIGELKLWSKAQYDEVALDETASQTLEGASLHFAMPFWRERVVQNDQPYDGHPFVSVIEAGGQLGFVPKRARPGDAVCIILGLQALYLLRAVGPSWQLIGECFLPAFMMGEQLCDIRQAYDEEPAMPWQDFRVV
ncbi:hypothetical protein AMS68_000561 [Peltaster fructicola]|uniref:Heterokaryon incompatibility domain-containing protein n=1 Tax=Peltaster fructicola TaxID=286661 RepID=A0A6H0XJZ5_9PEZI|nr:hypothetical protein AMS68_000561 [Peltaster fructicola]